MGKSQNEDVRGDIQLLLECLEYQKGNYSAMKQALVTLSSAVCGSASQQSQDTFRELGGIQKVLKIVTSSKNSEITEVGLFCLGNAVEKNVYSQKLLSTASFLSFLHGILIPTVTTPLKKRQMAAFVLLCLVSNYNFGQNMARQSSCLHDIISLIRVTLSRNGDSQDNQTIELWATLVRAACVCVNNPVNEENQKICSSLFPYLLSVLGNHTDIKILKPVLSLMCLTVSYNAQNQGKISKCGGLQILIKKLKSLQNHKDNPGRIQITIQLVCTLDVCLTENEVNSRTFGELGGVELVLHMLLDPGLNCQDRIQLILTLAHAVDAYEVNSQTFGGLGGVELVLNMLLDQSLNCQDRIQLILTLAHAVDAHAPNKDLISKGNGIKILIQQMTQSKDEELLKTTKYLLHMCVSSDTQCMDEGEDGTMLHLDSFTNKLEEMKRHSDMEILKKLNDLDTKLKDIGHRDTDVRRASSESLNTLTNHDVFFPDHLPDLMTHPFVARSASVCSSNSVPFHQNMPTPREKTLMDELVKEKMEKEKLEKLNHMLQEDVVMSRKALTEFDKTNQRLNEIENNLQKKHSHSQSGSEISARIHNSNRRIFSARNDLQNGQFNNINYPLLYQGPSPRPFTAHPLDRTGKWVESNSRNYFDENTNLNTSGDFINNNFGDDFAPSNNSYQQFSGGSQSDVIYPDNDIRQMPQNIGICLNNNAQTRSMTKPKAGKTLITKETSTDTQTEMISKVVSAKTSAASTSDNNGKQNAEIQCGTPWVTDDKDKEADSNTQNESCQTYFPDRSKVQKRKLIDCDKTKTVSTDMGTSSTRGSVCSVGQTASAAKVKVQNVIVSQPDKSANEVAKKLTIGVQNSPSGKTEKQSKKSEDIFVKPIAAPPRKKVRVTPLLGIKKVLNQNKTVTYMYNPSIEIETASVSDVQSEFDLQLVKAIRNAAVKPSKSVNKSINQGTNVNIKSQNNTRKIDKHLEDSRHESAHRWQVMPSTPDNQYVVPVRPAFSDCGTRRFNFPDSPYSVKSVGCLGKNNLSDNRMDTPHDINNGSPGSSSVDSDIEYCRSNSDESVDEKSVNITAAALRSNSSSLQQPCPGCNYISDEPGQILTSRNYNIVLETHPNTCKYHRQVRVHERKYIKTLKKQVRKRKRKSAGRLLDFGKSQSEKKEQKSYDDFPSDSDSDNVSKSSIKTLKKQVRKRKRKSSGRLLDFGKSQSEKKQQKSYDDFPSDSDSGNVSPPEKDDDPDFGESRRLTRANKPRRRRVPYSMEEEMKETFMKKNPLPNDNMLDWSKFKDIVSPPEKDDDPDFGESRRLTRANKPRRRRVPYSMEEETNLREGVRKLGKHWNQILATYNFHPSRTNVDLMDKYKRMVAAEISMSEMNSTKPTKMSKPFSLCEERRLRKGVKMYGHNWKGILQAFNFDKGRTSEELRNRWRVLQKRLDL